MKKLPRILIVDGEPAIAEMVAVSLRNNGFQPTWTIDAKTAQQELHAAVPDVILLDWMLSDESGLSLLRKLRADPKARAVCILMVTARDDEQDKVLALDAGADDYVLKPFSTNELMARIRAVMRRRENGSNTATLAVHDLVLDDTSHRVTYQNEPLAVAPMEFKLLRHLMKHPERVHSRQQLLHKVWGDKALIEERTVDVHVKRLRVSLGAARPLLETVRGAGYRLSAIPQRQSSV